MSISADKVKELRQITNAGMMSCKNALTETNGDIEAAIKLLREKGEIKRGDRTDRQTPEGVICAYISDCGSLGVLLTVNCETDFVAKNESFQAFAKQVTTAVGEGGAADIESANSISFGGETVEKAFGAKFTELGEVIKIGQLARFEGDNSFVKSYIHMGGQVGVLVEFGINNEATKSTEAFQALSNDIALQIAAMKPLALTRDEVNATAIQDENEINRKQLEAEGKPAAMIEKLLQGKISKFYQDVVLLEQTFVKDGESTITSLLAATSKEVGDTITIKRFVRFSVGG
jgi:elongation factor Ts